MKKPAHKHAGKRKDEKHRTKYTRLICGAIACMLIGAVIFSVLHMQRRTVPPVKVAEPIEIQPQAIMPGDPVYVTVNATGTPSAILWDAKSVPIFHYAGKTRALLPVSFNEKVLAHTVTVQFVGGGAMTKDVRITPREKIEKPLGIPEKLGGNTQAAATTLVNNLARENAVLNAVHTEPEPLWNKTFRYPLTDVFVTDPYGYGRQTVNQSIAHKGTDFRAVIGTDVHAMNRGIVRIARPFTVYGNTVVIDHGLGVQTLYMHMSELRVREGDVVELGTLLGKSGDTGYVEAAHLHISVKIRGVSIDPMTFMGFFTPKISDADQGL
ncbi:MAG: peptidase [Candidatus Taylorbacteria bacterium]|nr:peptidase [Candidatus Taylorbacteria bacterium]